MSKIVSSPGQLKNLNANELLLQAELIREFLINKLSITGGHIGSNLGIVELTMALHYKFNSPCDKFIFDVGHQCYVHKILTGRQEGFDTLRKYRGMSGFIKENESVHDVWEAGHSSTSISAAAGFAMARDLDNKNNEVIAIIGDGSLTNGMPIEALNHICELKTKVIVIINDNEMSISRNVGFVDNILKSFEYSKNYKDTKSKVHDMLDVVPFGQKISEKISKSKGLLKYKINGSQSFFNLLGYDYIGTVDGHNFDELFKAFDYAKESKDSVIIHIKTKKGKGYSFSEENSWHGISPFDKNTGKVLQKSSRLSYSQIVANHLSFKMKEDEDIVVITPAMIGGSALDTILEKFPDRLTDVGIAEEHALTFAGALAKGGKKPFVSIYSTFLQRAYDQVNHDICRINANVVIGIDRAGLVGEDGDTHQGIFDISFLSHLPNMLILQGKNDIQTYQLLDYAFKHQGPVAIRYPRGGNFEKNTCFYPEIKSLNWEIIKEGNLGVVITFGEMINHVIDLGLNLTVVNAFAINKIDEQILSKYKDKKIIIIEEHTFHGGLYSLIASKINIKMYSISLETKYIEQGNVECLLRDSSLYGDKLLDRLIGILGEE